MKFISKISLVLLAATVFAGQASALPLPGRKGIAPRPSFAVDADFEGIVALNNCSGAIVRFERSRGTDQAMVLTNGHCFEGGFIDPETYVLNEPSRRGFAVIDPRDWNHELGRVRAEKVIYATMTRTDITLYRLVETYDQIDRKYGTRPFTLARSAPPIGTKIEIASGYHRRAYACSIDAIIPTINEADWRWKSSIRYSSPGCEIISGTSGSPIVERGTREIVGVNNTSNENGEKCTLNNPCEVDRNGKVYVEKGAGYGQQTHWIYNCLDENLNFNVKLDTCNLPGGPRDSSDSVRLRFR